MALVDAAQKKRTLAVFGTLAVLTALEVGVALPHLGLGKSLMISALVGLALTKAGLVATEFMHLRFERRALQLTVLVPMVIVSLYAVVLILESAWKVSAGVTR